MTASPVRRLAGWKGRALLVRLGSVCILGAVVFWWGAIVAPQLFSIAFPDIYPRDVALRHLDAEREGSIANTVAAVALLIAGILAFVNAVQSFGRFGTLTAGRLRTQGAVHGRIAAGGWAALAVTAVYLAWEEVSEFHVWGTHDLRDTVFGSASTPWLWPVVLSPLIVAFVLAMGVFVHKGLRDREVRTPLVAGLATWLLVVVYEVSYPFVFRTRAQDLAALLEETMEFGGTLLIGLSAVLALRPVRQADGEGRPWADAGRVASVFSRRRLIRLAVGSAAVVAVLAVIAPVVYQGPLIDARARAHVGTFYVSLYDRGGDEYSLVQELGVLAAPVTRFNLRLGNHDPQGRSGTMLWRIMEAGEGGVGPLLREGRKEVPAREYPSWERVVFPPLEYAEGRPLALQLVADVEPEADLRIGATKTNRFPDGRLWINGEPAWPDQNIEFSAYMARTPTLGKLRVMWDMFASGWRWPVLAVEAAIGMTVVTFIPALLVTAVLRRRDQPAPGSLTNSS